MQVRTQYTAATEDTIMFLLISRASDTQKKVICLVFLVAEKLFKQQQCMALTNYFKHLPQLTSSAPNSVWWSMSYIDPPHRVSVTRHTGMSTICHASG